MADNAPVAFRLWTRLTKAMPDADTGEIIHGGIFHDESEDLDGDVLPFEMLQKSFGYLATHGKHNWNHGAEAIGDVLSIEPVTASDAKDRFGVTITGRGTALTGNLYPLIDPALAHQDLKTAHHRFLAKARIGYSVDGMCSRGSDGTLRSVVVPRVSLCDQPINATTMCRRLVKGMTAMVGDTEIGTADIPAILKDMEEAPDVLVDLSVPGGPERIVPASVVISNECFGYLISKAFPREDRPALGHLHEAIDKQQGMEPHSALRKAFDALGKA